MPKPSQAGIRRFSRAKWPVGDFIPAGIFWLIWFINQRALYNHELSIVIGIIGISVVICVHLPLAQG